MDRLPSTFALLGAYGSVREATPPSPADGTIFEEGDMVLAVKYPNHTDSAVRYHQVVRSTMSSNVGKRERQQQIEHLEKGIANFQRAKTVPDNKLEFVHGGNSMVSAELVVAEVQHTNGDRRSSRTSLRSQSARSSASQKTDALPVGPVNGEESPSVQRQLSFTKSEKEPCSVDDRKSQLTADDWKSSSADLVASQPRKLTPPSVAPSSASIKDANELLYPYKGDSLKPIEQEDLLEEGIPPDIRWGAGMVHFQLELHKIIARNVPPARSSAGCCGGAKHVVEVAFDTQHMRSGPLDLSDGQVKWERDNLMLFIHQTQAEFAKEEEEHSNNNSATATVAGVVTITVSSVVTVAGVVSHQIELGTAKFSLKQLLTPEENPLTAEIKAPNGRRLSDGMSAPADVQLFFETRDLPLQMEVKGPPTLNESLAGCEDSKERELIRMEGSHRLSAVFEHSVAEKIDTTVIDGGPRAEQDGRGRLKDTLVEYESRELEDKEELEYWREKLAMAMESPVIHALVMLVVVVDILQIIIYTAVFNTDVDETPLQIGLNISVVVLFVVELLLRQLAWQWRFWRDKWNIFDAIVIWASVLIMIGRYSYAVAVANRAGEDDVQDEDHTTKVLRIVSRVAVGLRMLRLMLDLRKAKRLADSLQTRIQKTISQNKRRYKKYGFDLDLTYISSRVVAMSAPAFGGHTAYRNDIHVVSRFLSLRHYGHFFVINLCDTYISSDGSMGNYHPQMLFNQVMRVPVEDHCPPLFTEFIFTCEAAARWMRLHPRNVVAIHCKGGKGRTGLVIGGLLMWTGHRRCAEDALELFTFRRTFDYRPELGLTDTTEGEDPFAGSEGSQSSHHRSGKGGHNQGVEGPSQKRYMYYLEAALYNSIDFWTCKKRFLSRIQLLNCAGPKIKPWFMSYVISCQRIQVLDSLKTSKGPIVLEDNNILLCDVEVWGDVRVDVYQHSSDTQLDKRKLMFFVYMHVAFHARDKQVVFAKKNVDLLHKDRRHRKVGSDFRMEFEFGSAPTDSVMRETESMKTLFRKHGRKVFYKKGDIIVEEKGKEEKITILLDGSVEGVVREDEDSEEGTSLQSYHPLGNCIPYPGDGNVRVPMVTLLGSDSVLGIGHFLASQGLGIGRTMPLRAREDLSALVLKLHPDELEGCKAGSYGVYRTSEYFAKRRARGMEGREQRWCPQGDGVEEVKEEGVLGLTTPELATLYRGMAIWMATYLERLRVEQARMTALRAMNDRQSALVDQDQREKLHRSILSTFKLPVNEQLVFTCKCKGRYPGEDAAGQWIRVCVTGSHVILDKAYFGPSVAKDSRLIRADQLISAKFPDLYQSHIIELHFETPCNVPEDEEITVRTAETPPPSSRSLSAPLSAGLGSLSRGLSMNLNKKRKDDEQERMELVFSTHVRARQCLEELSLLMKQVKEDSEHSKEHMTGTREMNELVRSCSEERQLRKGDKIPHAATTDALFLIQRGCIRLTRNGVVEEVVREGSSFGLTNFVKRRVSVSYEAEASEDSVVWELLPSRVQTALGEDWARKAEFALHICMLLDGHIKDTLRLGYPGSWCESENEKQSIALPSVRAPQSRMMQSLLTKRSQRHFSSRSLSS